MSAHWKTSAGILDYCAMPASRSDVARASSLDGPHRFAAGTGLSSVPDAQVRSQFCYLWWPTDASMNAGEQLTTGATLPAGFDRVLRESKRNAVARCFFPASYGTSW